MIGIGVIGYGYWGPNLVRNFANTPDVKVVAVSDLNAQRLDQIRNLYPTIKLTTDARDLFVDPTVDAIVIATPVATHFDLAMQGLRAGKHVLVEKPLTSTSEQGERLLAEAHRRKLVLMVDHTFVYTAAVRKIRELVDSGRLGRLYYYDSVRINLGLFQHDVNVLWDLAVHDLSIMDYVLAAKPCAVAATGIAHVAGQQHDVAYMTCFFENSMIAHFHVNWLAPVKIRRTLVGGDQRMIVYDDLEPSEKVKVYDKGITLNNGGPEGRYQLLVGYRAGDMWAPQLTTGEALRVEAAHFIECINRTADPLTGGEVGLRIVRILEAGTQSISMQGRPVELKWVNDDKGAVSRSKSAIR
jgi:predicted dehydrogenase